MEATSDYARAALHAAENIDTKTWTPSIAVQVAGVRAVTYALLDLAQAIREHGRA